MAAKKAAKKGDKGDLTEDSERMCQICMSAPRAVRFHPCGHSVTCEHCTLQLIAKCPGSFKPESLLCTHCKTPITKIEKDRAGAPKLSRQKTFQPSALDPLSVAKQASEQATATDQESDAQSGVKDFISSFEGSADEELRKAAEAAAKTWATGATRPGLDVDAIRRQMGLGGRTAVPPHPVIRMIAGAFAISYIVVCAWGLYAVAAVRADFNAFVASDSFSVNVTRADGIEGPVNALTPPSYDVSALGPLEGPTDHQRWWALVSDDATSSADTSDVILARNGVFWMAASSLVIAVLRPLHFVLTNHPATIATLATGLELTVNMAWLGSLFPLYWDSSRGFVLILYVPGWALVWSIVWSIVTAVLCACVPITFTIARATNNNISNRLVILLGCLATASCCCEPSAPLEPNLAAHTPVCLDRRQQLSEARRRVPSPPVVMFPAS